VPPISAAHLAGNGAPEPGLVACQRAGRTTWTGGNLIFFFMVNLLASAP
jgi:hypothetical protein